MRHLFFVSKSTEKKFICWISENRYQNQCAHLTEVRSNWELFGFDKPENDTPEQL